LDELVLILVEIEFCVSGSGIRLKWFFVCRRKMQHAPATIEEQLILKAIKEECPWEKLPKRLQATLSSKEEWHRR